MELALRAKSSTKDYQNDRVTSSKEKAMNVVIFIVLFVFAITMVFPLIYMVATSFMTKNQILSGSLTLFPNPILIGKYSQVLSKGQFISGIINTITVEIPVLLIGGFTSSLAAFAFVPCTSCNNHDTLRSCHDSAVRAFHKAWLDKLPCTPHYSRMLRQCQHDILPQTESLQHTYRAYGCCKNRWL